MDTVPAIIEVTRVDRVVIASVYRSGWLKRKWDWRARSGGDVVATSGNQRYENRADCIGYALKFSPPGSRVVDEVGVVVREGRSEA